MKPSPTSLAEDVVAALPLERAWLVRLCASLSGDPAVAEDLAQETLLEAWRHLPKLHDPDGLRPWLAAIARNVCLRWRRTSARAWAGRVLFPQEERLDAVADSGPTADVDLEAEVERAELAGLLDGALGRLPAAAREVLVGRYHQLLPVAELAARWGVSEDAAAKRLERAKRALARVVADEFGAEVAAYGVVLADPEGWRETPIWCPDCDARRLEGRFDPMRPLLALRCPACHPPGVHTVRSETLDIFGGLTGYKPALNRLMAFGHDHYALALADGSAPCFRCGAPADLLRRMPPEGPLRDVRGIHLRCARCRSHNDISLGGLALWHPAGRRFWKTHGRIRVLPEQEETVGSRAAVVVGFEARGSRARLEIVFALPSYEPIDVRGAVGG